MHINAHICKGSSWKLVVKCVTQRDPTPAAGQQLPNNLLVLSSLVPCALCCANYCAKRAKFALEYVQRYYVHIIYCAKQPARALFSC